MKLSAAVKNASKSCHLRGASLRAKSFLSLALMHLIQGAFAKYFQLERNFFVH